MHFCQKKVPKMAGLRAAHFHTAIPYLSANGKMSIFFGVFLLVLDILPFVDIIKTDIHLQEAIVCQTEFL